MIAHRPLALVLALGFAVLGPLGCAGTSRHAQPFATPTDVRVDVPADGTSPLSAQYLVPR